MRLLQPSSNLQLSGKSPTVPQTGPRDCPQGLGPSRRFSTPTWWWKSCCARASPSRTRAPAALPAVSRPARSARKPTSDGVLQSAKVLEIALNNGLRSAAHGKRIGIETGQFQTYEQVSTAFRHSYIISSTSDPRQQRHRAPLRAPHAGVHYLSLLVKDVCKIYARLRLFFTTIDGGRATIHLMSWRVCPPDTCTDSLSSFRLPTRYFVSQRRLDLCAICWKRLPPIF